jgi:hypothetical protein
VKAPIKTEGKGKKLDAPMPLSEFAKRGKTQGGAPASGGTGIHHSGHGRRDQLSAGERTRILRMLRDEGGRLADEDSQVYIGAPPPVRDYDFDFDEGPAKISAPPAPTRPPARADIPAKPAVVVGIAQAQSRKKKPSVAPPPPVPARPPTQPPPPPTAALRRDAQARSMPPPSSPPQRSQPRTQPPPAAARGNTRRPVPPPFSDEPTRQVDDDLLTALRSGQMRPTPQAASFNDEPTRLAPPSYDDSGFEQRTSRDAMSKFPANAPATDPQLPNLEPYSDEKTSIASLDGIAAMERARHHGVNDERTRAVNIRNDPSISDIDWDLD